MNLRISNVVYVGQLRLFIGQAKLRLRIDYCGLGPFSSTLTEILILISLPTIQICIIH